MDALEPAQGADVGRGIAASLLANVSSLADDMLRYLVERIPEVGGDAELRGLTLGSCSSNLEAVLSMVRHGIDVAAAEAPVTALEHARAMASRGHSVDVMLRFYRLGHEYFTEEDHRYAGINPQLPVDESGSAHGDGFRRRALVQRAAPAGARCTQMTCGIVPGGSFARHDFLLL